MICYFRENFKFSIKIKIKIKIMHLLALKKWYKKELIYKSKQS